METNTVVNDSVQTYLRNRGYEEVDCPLDDLDISSFEGYKTNIQTELNLLNYLESMGYHSSIFDDLKTKFDYIGVLKNLYVDPDYRNKGYGNELMEVFIDECIGVDAIILIADTLEDNDFNLVNWYKEYGFEIIPTPNHSLPLMIFDLKNN